MFPVPWLELQYGGYLGQHVIRVFNQSLRFLQITQKVNVWRVQFPRRTHRTRYGYGADGAQRKLFLFVLVLKSLHLFDQF